MTVTPNKDLTVIPAGATSPVYDVPWNANMSAIDAALGGSTLLDASSHGGGTVNLSATQVIPLSLLVSGSPTGPVAYTAPSGVGGQWEVENGTTGGHNITFASLAGGSAITIAPGNRLLVSCDGSSTGMRQSVTVPPSAAGSDTQVQTNQGGLLAGHSNFTFNESTGTLSVPVVNATTSVTGGFLKATSIGFIFPDGSIQSTAWGPGSPTGPTGAVQFNQANSFAGDSGLEFSDPFLFVNSLSLSGLLTGTMTNIEFFQAKFTPQTVASLGGATAGYFACLSDAAPGAWGSVVTQGVAGGNVCLAWANGSNWTIIGKLS